MASYRPGPWPGEDGGASRPQFATMDSDRDATTFAVPPGGGITVTPRFAPVAQMAVTRDEGELFLLLTTPDPAGPIPYVERIDPVSLEPLATSVHLPTGPNWPGSIAAHANGSLYVVANNHAHRLEVDLGVSATTRLPRNRPYNGLVILDDGHLVTKDFAGSRPDLIVPEADREPCELVVLEPDTLEIVARCTLSEPSIARLSALDNDLYVVGDTSLLKVHWDGQNLTEDRTFVAPYRTMDGQTYGWDCTLALGAAWFLDNGDGSHAYTGTMRGHGVSTAPLHLVRVDLETAGVTLTEVCGRANGLIANPPLVDPRRRIAVAYDSGNGIMSAFDIAGDGSLSLRWTREQNHAAHLLLFPESGQVLSEDHDAEAMAEEVVILDIATGAELARAPSGSLFQSPVFPTLGFSGDAYLCSMVNICRIEPTPAA